MFPFSTFHTSALLQELKDYPVYPDPSLKAFEGATLRYASLKLKYIFIFKQRRFVIPVKVFYFKNHNPNWHNLLLFSSFTFLIKILLLNTGICHLSLCPAKADNVFFYSFKQNV